MAPKRKASAAAAKEAKKKEKEAAAAAAAASEADEKQQSAKKAKPEPAAKARERGRPAKTAPTAAAKPKETATKAKGSAHNKAKSPAPAPEEPEAVKKLTDSPPPSAAESKFSKHIIIEHCKQCNSFKTRALKVKESLEVKVQGAKVSLNLEKPRRGCFEIRDEQGNIFVSLLDMPRPFKKLKELNLETMIDEIVEKIK